MQSFLEQIFGDAITPDRQLAIFCKPGAASAFFDSIGDAAKYVRAHMPHQNVYYSVGLMHGVTEGRGKTENVVAIGGLWGDVDLCVGPHKNKPLPASVEDVMQLVDRLGLRPTVIVFSGHGVHLYWLFKEPWTFDNADEHAQAAALAKRWHRTICARARELGWNLENLGDLARVLRLPGTLNHFDGTLEEVRIHSADYDRRYNPGDFEPYLVEDVPEPTEAEVQVGNLTLHADAEPPASKLLALTRASSKFQATWDGQRTDLSDTSQSGYDLSLATIAALAGWTDQDIADLIIAARRTHGEKPEKALRGDYMTRTIAQARRTAAERPAEANDVDLSALLPTNAKKDSGDNGPADPGPLPDEMLRIPGFVSEVMDHCLAAAPYPSPVMAFCGALALQSFLAGRKVRDPGDNRSNIYLLGLAHSSAGKDHPRKVNARIMHEIGLANCLGERFASGEGIQDSLFVTPAMLFQTDEIDGILQSINKAKDARHENIMSTLLTMYSAANSVYPMRRKAGKEAPGVIDQPSLTVFGTAIPNHYYDALSERMLTNGFFARMVIIEAGPRCEGQEPRVLDLPPRVLKTAKWWEHFQPGEHQGNLQHLHPIPAVVEYADDAMQLLVDARREAEAEYSQAEAKNDPVGTTVWGRVSEQTRKLALLYAVSENHRTPLISADAVQWASTFVRHQTRRMLFMAQGHVADNPFHAECLKALRKVREAPGHVLPHSILLKRMKMDARTFRELIDTLVESGDIASDPVTTAGRTGVVYRLVGG
jgi:hypothetical protein